MSSKSKPLELDLFVVKRRFYFGLVNCAKGEAFGQ